ncbi:4-hydroxyphenylpyruvate dioxygenase-like protein isoform X2 [Penaeus japonicus]|nr:4-hydroxyphenylpyruvate dioxygenase-like protein isoform X2 [Penaeus japonicus]XP_042868925.1 4-hydroxyphenylpyruvate dioxygenase-like protein isoform X2 [Penaeus japonicus]
MSCSVLHHVEVCVKDEAILELLTHGFGFIHCARRVTHRASQWVLKSGGCVFVVTKRLDEEVVNGNGNGKEMNDGSRDGKKWNMDEERSHMNGFTREDEHWTVFCCQNSDSHAVDSVFNIALVVRNVDSVTERVRAMGGRILREPCDLANPQGKVRYAIVTSCCGNIVHTLIDKSHYNGDFLPGFEPVEHTRGNSDGNTTDTPNGYLEHTLENGHSKHSSNSEELARQHKEENEVDASQNLKLQLKGSPASPPLCTHIDHVTYVCRAGESRQLLDWYEQCFGMKRFFANGVETEADGFVLGGNIGLRLKAMEYWRCAETGLLSAPGASMQDSSLKLVIAEPLPDVSTSHVETFLRAHGGPGVQHIGLHTPTMANTVAFMAGRGVVFRKPPPVYYEEGVKLNEIEEAGHGSELSMFRDLGILLDTEADIFSEMEEQEGKKKYLMQVFTGPIFKQDTFFLEVIQRCGARGFGAGNITALAKSIILYNEQQQKLKT